MNRKRATCTLGALITGLSWRILHHHVVTALTMMKIANILTKNENDAFLFDADTYVEHDIDRTVVKE